MRFKDSSSHYRKIQLRSDRARRWSDMRRARGPAVSPPGVGADELLASYLAGDADQRPVKWATVSALLVHFFVFLLVVPETIPEPLRVDAPSATLIVRRYKPPAPPARAKKTRKKMAAVVPIPDPTPDEPEAIEPEASDFDFGDFDAEFAIGLPDAPPGLSGSARSGAFRAGAGGVAPPVVVRQVDPEYTPDATRRGVQGEVWIEAVVDTEGRVVEPRLLRGLSDDELNRRALEAIQQWLFQPGMKDGSAVPVIAVFTVTFRLH